MREHDILTSCTFVTWWNASRGTKKKEKSVYVHFLGFLCSKDQPSKISYIKRMFTLDVSIDVVYDAECPYADQSLLKQHKKNQTQARLPSLFLSLCWCYRNVIRPRGNHGNL